MEVDGVKPDTVIAQTATPPSLVVLPFDNMSTDPEQEFLADGIVEDVTTELSRFRTLTVIARNSAFAYKNTPKDVRDIAQELGVKYVVEGSVRRSGDRLRVTAQLIEAETGAHLWAERWDRMMADLFDVQDELTSAIVTGVEPELGAHERTLSRRKPTESLTAWELSQKGYAQFLKFTSRDNDAALELYRKSIRLDPDFALAHALAARAHYARVSLGWSENVSRDTRAGLDLANRAIELDPKSDYGHAIRAGCLKALGRQADAMSAFEMAERLNPNSVVLCMARSVAEFFNRKPDPDVIEDMATRALRLSPHDPQAYVFYTHIGLARLMRNAWHFDDSVSDALELSCRFSNTSVSSVVNTAIACLQLGRREDAIHYLNMAKAKEPDLTKAVHWERVRIYPWIEDFLKVNGDVYDKLVEIGLPEA